MSNRFHVVLMLPIVLAAAMPGAAAQTASGTYALASPPGALVQFEVEGMSIGGVLFPATGKAPLEVAIADATGGAVGFRACQDLDGDGQFCEFGEPNQNGCGTGAALRGFRGSAPTLVYVKLADPMPPPGCLGAATTGTVTVTYAR